MESSHTLFAVWCTSGLSVICFDGCLCTFPHVRTCWCTRGTPFGVVMWPDGNVNQDFFPNEGSRFVPADSLTAPFNSGDRQHVSMAALTCRLHNCLSQFQAVRPTELQTPRGLHDWTITCALMVKGTVGSHLSHRHERKNLHRIKKRIKFGPGPSNVC